MFGESHFFSHVLGPAIVCSIAAFVTIMFLHYYGIFKLPWYVSSSLIVYGLVVVFMTFGLLPYDISVSLFGPDDYDNTALKITIECLYWGTWILGWGLTPVFCCVYTYKYALTVKRRIWYSIRYNLVWYAIAFAIGFIALMVYIAETSITIKNLIALGYACCNAYGLSLIVVLLGHGLIALPRSIWRLGDPINRVNFLLDNLNSVAKEVASSTVNGQCALSGLNKLSGVLPRFYEELVRPNLDERIKQLEKLLDDKPLPYYFYDEVQPDKKFKELINKNWSGATQYDIENIFCLVDMNIISLDESLFSLNYYADCLVPAIKKYKKYEANKFVAILRNISLKFCAIILFLLTATYCWADITLMIGEPKYNLYHFLTYLNVPSFINQLCVTTPILGFLMITGGWSCSKLKCGKMYRFIPHKSNDYTLYYWIVIMGRLAPSIAYNYVNQIDATDTTVFEVYGSMRDIAFIGNAYNIYLPCLMFLIMIFVAFNVWNKIIGLFGYRQSPDGSNKENEKKFNVFVAIKPEEEELITSPPISSLASIPSTQPLLW